MARKKKQAKKVETKPAMFPSVLRQVTHSEGFDERRKTARLDLPIKVQYKVIGQEGNHKGAVTKDMSAGGCLLLVTEELFLNSDIALQIMLGEGEIEALRLKGKIVRLNRAEKDLYEYGIAFNALSSETRRLFADYCFAKMYQMIGLPEWPTDKRLKKE